MTRDEFVARRAVGDDHLVKAQNYMARGSVPGAKAEAHIAQAANLGIIADLLFAIAGKEPGRKDKSFLRSHP